MKIEKMDREGHLLRRSILLKRWSRRLTSVLRTVFLVTMCFVVLYPLLYMLSVSFRESRDLYDPTVIWVPKHWTGEHYSMVWETISYPSTLVRSIVLASVATLFNVGVCSVIGYGFARFNFRGKGLLFGLVVFTLIVPPQTISIPMYVQYHFFDFLGLGQLPRLWGGEAVGVNLLNTPWTLYMPAMLGQGLRSGLFIFIFRQFFRSMPRELEDAAYIDGCGITHTFLRIMAVNAGPAYISSLMFSFVWYWNEYYQVGLYFTDAETLAVALGTLSGMLRSMGMDFYSDPYAVVAQMQAACMLTVAPLIIAFIFLQRKFTQSIDKTGIVG